MSPFPCQGALTPYSCSKCQYSTRLKTQLKHHKKRKHPNEEEVGENCHKCEHCPFKTHTLMLLFKHKITHLLDVKTKPEEELTVKRYICDDCYFETHSCIVHLNHRINCALKPRKNKWHRCGKCEFKTKVFRLLEPHRIEKHWLECYACKFCFYKSRTLLSLTHHLSRSHVVRKSHVIIGKERRSEMDQWFRCEDCQYICKAAETFKRHIYMVHSSVARDELFACEFCTFRTTSRGILREHVAYYHEKNKDDLLKFKCSKCDFFAFSRLEVERHCIRNHIRNTEWFHCYMCEYKCKNNNNLMKHTARKHLGLSVEKYVEDGSPESKICK